MVFFRLFLAFVVSIAGQVSAFAQSASIERAIAFLQNACVTSGSSTSVDISSTASGELQISGLAKAGRVESVTFTRKELEGLADSASQVAAQQATEMRSCMKPHIDKIIAALLSPVANGGAGVIQLETVGEVFVTTEFDTLMLALAGRPKSRWAFNDLAKEVPRLHPAKIEHYLNIAAKNLLIRSDEDCVSPMYGCYWVLPRGVSYVVTRGLAK